MTKPQPSQNMQDAMHSIIEIYRFYDLAGSFIVCNSDGFQIGYVWDASWNALVLDETLEPIDGNIPLGFRIRIKQEEIGFAKAKELAEETVEFLSVMRDFGKQLDHWMRDLMDLLRKRAGWHIKYTPFQGKKLPRIGGLK